MSDTALSVSDEILSLLAQVPAAEPQRDALEALARGLLRRAPRELWQRVPPDLLLGRIRDLLAFVDARREPVAVRVVEGSDGSTVLEANTADSPFLVDTVRGAIAAQDLSVRTLLHPVFGIERAPDGSVSAIGSARGAPTRESVMRIELVERLDAAHAQALAAEVARSLGELRLAVADHAEMAAVVGRMIDAARGAGRTLQRGGDRRDRRLPGVAARAALRLPRDARLRDRRECAGPALKLVAGQVADPARGGRLDLRRGTAARADVHGSA